MGEGRIVGDPVEINRRIEQLVSCVRRADAWGILLTAGREPALLQGSRVIAKREVDWTGLGVGLRT